MKLILCGSKDVCTLTSRAQASELKWNQLSLGINYLHIPIDMVTINKWQCSISHAVKNMYILSKGHLEGHLNKLYSVLSKT